MTLIAVGAICLFAMQMLLASRMLVGRYYLITSRMMRQLLVFNFTEAAAALYLWANSQLPWRGLVLAFFLASEAFYSYEAVKRRDRLLYYSARRGMVAAGIATLSFVGAFVLALT